MVNPAHPTHPRSRRRALQVGGLGLFGLSLADVERLAEGAATTGSPSPRRSVLLIYLPGGLSHIDSFDPKPLASDKTRGDFDVIQTRIPDLRICEHLPLLASRSDRWSLVRSFGHPTNDHTQAHHYVLCGKMELPAPFDRAKPAPGDFPSMTAVAGSKLEATGPLPSVVMLPRLLINVARQVRGEVLQLKHMDYVSLAKVSGASTARILFIHIFPGTINTLIVVSTLQVGIVILLESTLSFLGAGVPPPTPAWGSMVADGRDKLAGGVWWISTFPGAAIMLTVMSLNWFGDWLRDTLDPRLRQLE